jgi:hypothetical protein
MIRWTSGSFRFAREDAIFEESDVFFFVRGAANETALGTNERARFAS